jgi:hypothetical protein
MNNKFFIREKELFELFKKEKYGFINETLKILTTIFLTTCFLHIVESDLVLRVSLILLMFLLFIIGCYYVALSRITEKLFRVYVNLYEESVKENLKSNTEAEKFRNQEDHFNF